MAAKNTLLPTGSGFMVQFARGPLEAQTSPGCPHVWEACSTRRVSFDVRDQHEDC